MKRLALLLTSLLGAATAFAQYSGITDRRGVPDWTNPPEFAEDVFTFVRLKPRIDSTWRVDFPDSDLNFSYRLQQVTSLRVNPNPLIIEPTSPELFNYPFIYLVEPKGPQFDEEEATCLRKYLLNGGFLMIDDFWGEQEWAHCREQLKLIFPDREPVELELDHPIFHTVFDMKEKIQIPAFEVAVAGRAEGRTWEREDAIGSHFYGIFDDKGRMMVMICRDTDLGDGWEREGGSEWFFHEFSEKKAYPMGINIVVYALTH